MPSLERMGPRSFSVTPDDKITRGSCDCILQYPTEASDKFFASRKLRLCVKVHCIKNFSVMALARKLPPSHSRHTLGSLILEDQICGYSRPRQGALSSLSLCSSGTYFRRVGEATLSQPPILGVQDPPRVPHCTRKTHRFCQSEVVWNRSTMVHEAGLSLRSGFVVESLRPRAMKLG